jgi:hypothetical protein
MTKAQERISVYVFGVAGIITMLVLAIAFPIPSKFQYDVFKIVLSLAAAGVAAMIPGFIEVTIPGWLKAGGALAVFALIMYKNPASIVAPEPPPVGTLNVEVVPDTVGIAPGKYTPIAYRFREVNGVQVTVDSQDVRWLLDNGDAIGQVKNARILGGSFTIEAKGQHELLDNVYMPPEIARKAQAAGTNQVQLETIFTAIEGGEKKSKAKAILRIGILG